MGDILFRFWATVICYTFGHKTNIVTTTELDMENDVVTACVGLLCTRCGEVDRVHMKPDREEWKVKAQTDQAVAYLERLGEKPNG